MIPKSINVLGMKIKVKQVKGLTNNNHPVHGYFDASNKLICIEKDMSNEDKWRTFFHELTHALTFRNGFVFSGMPDTLDEILAETNASMIYEVMSQIFGDWHD